MFNVLYDVVGLTRHSSPMSASVPAISGRRSVICIARALRRQRCPRGDQQLRPIAYQGIIGGAFPIASMPGFRVTADYRFMGLIGDRKYGATATTGAVATPATIKLSDDFNHTIMVGFRYAFGAPRRPDGAGGRRLSRPRRSPAPTWCSLIGTRLS